METKVLLNKNNVHANSTVLINLSNNQNSKRINVNESLTLGELNIDMSETAAPTYPGASIAEVNSSKMSPADKATAIEKLLSGYATAQASYVAGGGLSLQDKIVAGVVSWLCAKKGFSTSDKSDVPMIKPADLVVTSLPVGSEILFSVTGTACWG